METKTSSNPKNRRASLRKNPRTSVRVQCRRGSYGLGANLAESLLDLSQDGVRLVLKESLQPKGEVEVSFAGYGFANTIKLLGNVAWIVPLENGQFAVGIAFQKRMPFNDVMQLARP